MYIVCNCVRVPAQARVNLESGRSLKEVGLGKTGVDIERLLAREDSSSIIAKGNRCQVVVVVKGHAVAEESRSLFRRSRIFNDEIAAIPSVWCRRTMSRRYPQIVCNWMER